MSKREIIQGISIALLLIAILFLIPNTEWSNLRSICVFLSLIFGTLGSIISIYIPKSYTYKFDISSWINADRRSFQLIILSKTHGLGKATSVQTFMLNENSYEEVDISHKQDEQGNVIIESNSKFIGKVIIT